jgi:DNA-binding transcriptional MerR regulator
VPHGRYQIGEVAEAVGLSIRTLRHWDEVGIVVPSARTVGGFRLYTDDDIVVLGYVKKLKPLNFSLDEIKDLLELRAAASTGEHEAIERLELFAAIAEQRCIALRDQLEAAEHVATDLRESLDRVKDATRQI